MGRFVRKMAMTVYSAAVAICLVQVVLAVREPPDFSSYDQTLKGYGYKQDPPAISVVDDGFIGDNILSVDGYYSGLRALDSTRQLSSSKAWR